MIRLDRVKHKEYGLGTVLETHMRDAIGVRFDRPKNYFHDLGGLCNRLHGFYVSPESLIIVNELVPYDPTQQGDREDDI